MKKLISFVLVCVIVGSFCACGQSQTVVESQAQEYDAMQSGEDTPEVHSDDDIYVLSEDMIGDTNVEVAEKVSVDLYDTYGEQIDENTYENEFYGFGISVNNGHIYSSTSYLSILLDDSEEYSSFTILFSEAKGIADPEYFPECEDEYFIFENEEDAIEYNKRIVNNSDICFQSRAIDFLGNEHLVLECNIGGKYEGIYLIKDGYAAQFTFKTGFGGFEKIEDFLSEYFYELN